VPGRGLFLNTTRLRLPFFLLALLTIAAVVLVEHGAVSASGVATKVMPFLRTDAAVAFQEGLQIFSQEQSAELAKKRAGLAEMPSKAQGFAISSMQFVDGCILFTILLMGLALVLPPDKHARIQGAITLAFGVLLIIAAIASIFIILAKLILMVALLLSFPFGTIAYLLIYGSFPRASMNVILGLLFLPKIAFGVLLLLAHQGFIKNIGLAVFVAASFVAGLVVSFLYGLVPGVLVSITDAIAAIIVTIIGVVLGLILAIGSIPSVVKAVKV
jgi:hypothetical protein